MFSREEVEGIRRPTTRIPSHPSNGAKYYIPNRNVLAWLDQLLLDLALVIACRVCFVWVFLGCHLRCGLPLHSRLLRHLRWLGIGKYHVLEIHCRWKHGRRESTNVRGLGYTLGWNIARMSGSRACSRAVDPLEVWVTKSGLGVAMPVIRVKKMKLQRRRCRP